MSGAVNVSVPVAARSRRGRWTFATPPSSARPAATPGQAQEVHGYLRTLLTQVWGEAAAPAVRLQYGGSVRPENIAALMAERDIDGALVVGASLDAHLFAQLLMYGRK